LEPVQIWLAIEQNELVIYDKEGEVIPDHTGMAKLRAAAEARAVEEAQARAAAEARAVEEAQARAAAEARAVEEAQARAAAEAQMQALEAELRRLRGEG
jgi:membrane protein involved in colicin uptake